MIPLDGARVAVFALAEGRDELAREQFTRVRAADPGGAELEDRARASRGLKSNGLRPLLPSEAGNL